jgi:transcriptional regulator with XRE-family HTH domain
MTTETKIAASGMTDAEIAKAAGVNTSTAWRWRTGKVKPGTGELRKLAAVLSCTPADLRPDLAALFK